MAKRSSAKQKPGLPEQFSLNVSAASLNRPVNLGDYLDESDPKRSTVPSVPRRHAVPSHPQQVAEEARGKSDQDRWQAALPAASTSTASTGRAARRPARRRRKQINMRAETQKMAEVMLLHLQTYSPQPDTTASELFDALVGLVYDAREHLDLSRVPPRGSWGSPTARSFATALKRAFEHAIADRHRAKLEG